MEGKIYEPSRMVINPMSLARSRRGFMAVWGDVRKIYTSGRKLNSMTFKIVPSKCTVVLLSPSNPI